MAISGTYITVANSPIGKQEGIMVLEADGDTLKGSITAMGASVDFQNGHVSGDAFEFDIEAKTPMGMVRITVNGKVTGDKISGSFITTYGEMPFEGTRAEE